MQPPSELPLDSPFPAQASRRESVVQDRPTLGTMPLARRGAGWWLLPAVDFISSSLALIADRPAQRDQDLPRLPGRAAGLGRGLRAARRLWLPRLARRPVRRRRSRLAGDPLRRRRALRLGRLADHVDQRRRADRPLGPVRRPRQRQPSPHHPLPAAPQSARAMGSGRRRGDRAAAPRLRPAERLRDRGRNRTADPGLRLLGPRRRARGGRALPRRPHRHLQPARRRRRPARPGPRLQVDRRRRQPAAAARSTCSRPRR